LTGIGKDVSIHMGNPSSIYFCKPEGLAQSKWESIDFIVPGSKVSDHYEVLII